MTVDADTLALQVWAITGAAGRIGSSLRADLLAKVAGLVLIDTEPIADLRVGESAPTANLLDAASLEAAFEGVHGVIHLGAIPDEADFRDLAEVNILGSWYLLEAARRAGVRRVVSASSGRVLGMYDVTVTPDMPVRPDGLYAVSKVAGEALCRLYVDKFGLEAVCMRIGAFGDGPHDDRAISTWLSPADAARAFEAAMTQTQASFAILHAYSANEHVFVDLEPGRALGYDPQDNASDHLPALDGSRQHATEGRQAGELGTAEFTLSRQRPLSR